MDKANCYGDSNCPKHYDQNGKVSTSIFTSLSDIVVICGHDKGLVLIRFSGEHFFACDNFECGINITGWYTICCIG